MGVLTAGKSGRAASPFSCSEVRVPWVLSLQMPYISSHTRPFMRARFRWWSLQAIATYY